MIRLPKRAIVAPTGPTARLRCRIQPPPPLNARLLSRVLTLSRLTDIQNTRAQVDASAQVGSPRYSRHSLGVVILYD